MKKIYIILFFLIIVFAQNRHVFAAPLFQKNLLNPCILLGTCPTNTPTPTPTPVDCATKDCDNTTKPCKSGLTCIQANNGSNYCSLPDYITACKTNPTTESCCSAPPTLTPTPTITPTPTFNPNTSITPTPSLSISPTINIPTSPTSQKPKESSNAIVKDVGIGLVIVFLFSALIGSNWAKIKLWLHEKTK
jgi:hypothetical protein